MWPSPSDLWRILQDAYTRSDDDNLSIVSAGLAFFGLLAIIPSVAALISIYGLVADPADVQEQVAVLSQLVPADAWDILQDQLKKIVESPENTLSFRFLLSLVLTLWSSSRGMTNLISALNIAYEVKRRRSFIRFNLMGLALTMVAILLAIVGLIVVLVIPIVFSFVGLENFATMLVSTLRWPFFAAVGAFGLMIFYRYAPYRAGPSWRNTLPGAVTATIIWLAASALFSLYVSNFGSYDKTYGSLGAVVVLLMWFYISAYAVLFGAELNVVVERFLEGKPSLPHKKTPPMVESVKPG